MVCERLRRVRVIGRIEEQRAKSEYTVSVNLTEHCGLSKTQRAVGSDEEAGVIEHREVETQFDVGTA